MNIDNERTAIIKAEINDKIEKITEIDKKLSKKNDEVSILKESLEEAEKEYPVFQDQLKWTVISTQLIGEYKLEVVADDLKNFAKQQLMSYMGGQLGALGDNDQWLEDYAARMMQDRKFVEDSYHRISTDKLFNALEAEVTAKEEPIAAEKFADLLNSHKH